MPANKLRIVLPYSNLGDGDWSDQMDRCREMEIERLEAEESAGDHPAEQQLKADEIAELLDNATGDYGKAYDDIAGEYVRYFGATVSSRLKLKLGLSFFAMHHSRGYFDESDAIYALVPLDVVHELFDRSHKKRHHRFREQLGTKKEFGALLAKPLEKWNEREIGSPAGVPYRCRRRRVRSVLRYGRVERLLLRRQRDRLGGVQFCGGRNSTAQEGGAAGAGLRQPNSPSDPLGSPASGRGAPVCGTVGRRGRGIRCPRIRRQPHSCRESVGAVGEAGSHIEGEPAIQRFRMRRTNDAVSLLNSRAGSR